MTYHGIELGAAEESILDLEQRALACRECPLGEYHQNVVIARGMGKPTVVFIGEAPGETEDRAGEPFVGKAGENLDNKLLEHGLFNYAIINLINCRPPKNKWDDSYAHACRPFLLEKLRILHPDVVVLMGKHAKEQWEAGTGRLGFAPKALVRMLHPAAMMYNNTLWDVWDREWVFLAAELRRIGYVTTPHPVVQLPAQYHPEGLSE